MSATVATRERAKQAEAEATELQRVRDAVKGAMRRTRGLILAEAYHTGGSVTKALKTSTTRPNAYTGTSFRQASARKSITKAYGRPLCTGQHSWNAAKAMRAPSGKIVGTRQLCTRCGATYDAIRQAS